MRDLDRAWRTASRPQVCFGLQAVADANGHVHDHVTTKLNAEYGRVPSRFGIQREPRWSALMGQIPNNGWMINTALARSVGYSTSAEVSHACDFDFGLRVAQKTVESGGEWVLCPQVVSVVRLSDNSILRSTGPRTNYSDATWNLIEHYQLPPDGEAWRRDRLRRTAMGAMKKWLSQGRNLRAARVYFSSNFPPQRRFSKRGLLLGLMVFLPSPLNRSLLRRL
ncbi:hypothetical protein EON80_32705 [bacterium]|nr:MAG: hypothetical protein EON80_32705 [bacterium]